MDEKEIRKFIKNNIVGIVNVQSLKLNTKLYLYFLNIYSGVLKTFAAI